MSDPTLSKTKPAFEWVEVAPSLFRRKFANGTWGPVCRGKNPSRDLADTLVGAKTLVAKKHSLVEALKQQRREALEKAKEDAQNTFATRKARGLRGYISGLRSAPIEGSSVASLLVRYYDAGMPSSPRFFKLSPITKSSVTRATLRLLTWPGWKSVHWHAVTARTFSDYADFRRQGGTIEKGNSIDFELLQVSKAFRWAVWNGYIDANPLTRFPMPRFQDVETQHCRDFCPESGDALHAAARKLFQGNFTRQVVGWQMLVEAFTGLRTSEALALQWNPKHGQPGCIDGNVLFVRRSKHGQNPWVEIRPALRLLLQKFTRWRAATIPSSPIWFPNLTYSGVTDVPVNRTHISRLLRDIKSGFTSHAMRAFYVTARRSEFVPDEVIAAEIGVASGAELIVEVYGALPPNWRISTAGKVSFLPETTAPAWDVFEPTTEEEKILVPPAPKWVDKPLVDGVEECPV